MRSLRCTALFSAVLLLASSPLHAQLPAPPLPNSEAGLAAFMVSCLSAAQQHDSRALATAIVATEIPDYPTWFRTNYPGPAESWITPYGRNLKAREAQLEATFNFLATQQGAFTVHKIKEDPAHPGSLESGMLHGNAGPLDIYKVSWQQSATDKPLKLTLGFFYFINGGFRWDSDMITGFNQPLTPIAAIYPYPASDTQHIGEVLLRFHLQPDGQISPNTIVAVPAPNMSTDPKLVQAATQALLKSRYLPPAMFEATPDGTQTTAIYVSPLPPAKPTGQVHILILPKS